MTALQPENNIVSRPEVTQPVNFTQTFHDETHEHVHAEDTDKKIAEMARESYLMRREIAIIAAVFFLALIGIIMFAIGSMTQVNLPV